MARMSSLLFCALGLAACAAAPLPDAIEGKDGNASPAAVQSISWADAIALLKSGRVAVVVQLHDLSVTLTMADGQRHATTEPAIDAIFTAIRDHAPNADAIIVATE